MRETRTCKYIVFTNCVVFPHSQLLEAIIVWTFHLKLPFLWEDVNKGNLETGIDRYQARIDRRKYIDTFRQQMQGEVTGSTVAPLNIGRAIRERVCKHSLLQCFYDLNLELYLYAFQVRLRWLLVQYWNISFLFSFTFLCIILVVIQPWRSYLISGLKTDVHGQGHAQLRKSFVLF